MRMNVVVLLLLAFGTACAMDVRELTQDKADYEGKTVVVTGTVKSTVKIGAISAYVLQDKESEDTIPVSAQRLPVEGKTVTVKGILIRDSLFGYYIKADE